MVKMTRKFATKNISKEKKINFVLLGSLFAYVFIFILVRYLKFDYSAQFGYLDHQLYWEALHRLLDGQKIYKDFYWEYGPLYLYSSAPLFLLLGKTFKSYIIIRLIFLPLLGFFLSYLLARKILRGRWLILFLFISAFYSTIDFTTLRHIVAELGLVYALLGLREKNKKGILIGSFALGLSLTAGIEYALIAILSLIIYLIWHIYNSHKNKNLDMMHVLYSFSGPVIVAIIYFGLLVKADSFGNFVSFFDEFSNSFLTFSPCRSQFPELSKIGDTFNGGALNIWTQVRRWNLYLIPFSTAFLFFYIVKHWKKMKFAPELTALLLFSTGAYIRVMVNPCIHILAYGTTFYLLVLVYLFQNSQKNYIKIFASLLIILVFFSAVSGPADFINLLHKKIPEKSEMSLLKSQKIYLTREKYEQITEITNYLKEITAEGEYVYVYPYGPYNMLTNTKSPSNVIISTHFELAPFLVDKVIENLEAKKPRLVVINEINTWSYLASMHQIPEDVLDVNGTPVFLSSLTEVEKYLSQNYQVIKRFNKTLILERRNKPVELIPAYIKTDLEIIGESTTALQEIPGDDHKRYEIIGETPELRYLVKDVKDLNLVRLKVKGDKGIFKYSSIYLTNLFVLGLDYSLIAHNTDVLSTDWQDMWLFVPDKYDLSEGAIVMFRIYKNKGFFDIGGFPRNIDLSRPEFYKINPVIQEAIKKQKEFYN